MVGSGAVVAVLALGCSDKAPEAAPELDEPVVADKTCEALPQESVSSLFAADVELDEERSGPSSCAYVSTDGMLEVIVRLEAVPNTAAMDVAVSELVALVGGESEEVDAGSADQVVVIGGEADGQRAMVVRKGGFSAQLELTGFADEVLDDGRELVVDWLLSGFPEVPFDGAAVTRTLDCEAFDTATIAEALAADPEDVSVTPSVGSDACDAWAGSGATVRIHAPATGITAEELAALGRARTVDGVEYRSDPEPVEELGEAAVWVAEPGTENSGDLYVLAGNQLLRLTVSGNALDPEEMRARAVAVADVVVSDVTG